MKIQIGLWIDHEKAHIVALTEGGQEIRQIITSEAEPYHRTTGGRKHNSGSPQVAGPFVNEHHLQERQHHQWKQFYQEVIHTIAHGESFFIFGPGAAKTELKKEIKAHKALRHKPIALAPADHLTENQIAAKVRAYYSTPLRKAG